MKPEYTILVNSSDGFEDCWNPFFKLYETYWNDDKIPILLNTEWKDYSYKALPIRCSRSNSKNEDRRLSWSECLINALNQVETEYVLYLQEDYFIEQKVNIGLINDMIDLMKTNEDIKYIGLTHFGNHPPFKTWSGDNRLWEVSNKSKYRISTQAGIWRREVLLSYLRPNENGWMFEIFGTQRAKKRRDLFLTLNRDLLGQNNPVILYTHTGIIKGKWHKKMPDLFARHKILMDFNIRGIYHEKLWVLRKFETGFKLMKNPLVFYNGMRGK
jgi:hypothetical protein